MLRLSSASPRCLLLLRCKPMAGNGWIKLHRKLLDSAVFQNEKALKLWVWCLLRANHAPARVLLGRQIINLNRGQFIMGSNKESKALKIAKTTFWRWLEFFESEQMLELKKTTKYTIVTIPNWDLYQEVELKRDTSGTQVGTNKNEENVKKTGTAFVVVQEEIKNKKVTPEMQRVFDLFTHNPARFVWKTRVHIREAAQVLYDTYGIEELAKRYRISQDHRGEDMCPQIDDPSEFLEKMPKMENFLTKL